MSSVMGGYKSILNKNANKTKDAEETDKKIDDPKGSDSEYSDFEKAHEEIKFLEEEPVGNGLAGTLKNLRERGYLMDMEYSGRTNDALLPEDKNEDAKAAGDRIKLEYRDGSGKLMTPKEAYR
jgi:U4/U6.U5 tri-snRNP-associated protein 1